MGEIFHLIRPDSPLDFTGERLTTATSGQVEVEHLHRYFLARNFCRGLDVLDIASGEGYGSALLAQVARSVVGVEISADAVQHADRAYKHDNLRFAVGDARTIPLSDCSVDVVVSFETVEHIYEQEKFLAEVRRVLRPGGSFVSSTPDRDTYSPADSPVNPYHVRELSKAEFEELLCRYFANVGCLLQRPMMGSVMLAEKSGAMRPLTFERRGTDWYEGSTGLPRASYVVTFASDGPVDLPDTSLYIERTQFGLSLGDLSTATQRVASLEQEVERLRATVASARHMQDAHTNTLAELAVLRQQLSKALDREAFSVDRERRHAEKLFTTELRARDAQAEAQSLVIQADRRAAEAQQRVFAAERHAGDAERWASEAERRANEAERRANEAERRAGNAEAWLEAVRTSTTWRALAPVRYIVHRLVRRAPPATPVAVETALSSDASPRLVTDLEALPPGRDETAAPVQPTPEAIPPQESQEVEATPKTLLLERLERELARFLSHTDRLVFPNEPAPDISVILVLYNKAFFTLACLRSLLAYAAPSFEILIVDNGSSDETQVLLARVDNVSVISNRENLGFVAAVNQAAAAARGRALLLLNNDATPRADALHHALRTLDSEPNIGAVGCRIVLPSGELQEAGSIVWSDGSTLGYGRGLSPAAGEAQFRRDVNYCSGAFLLTRRDLFERLGGFDTIYSPAYYEEADYCLRLWRSGWRVVYEPRAVIDHYEFGSQDGERQAYALSMQNRKVFRSLHGLALARDHLPAAPANILIARHRPRDRPRLLVIDTLVPLSTLGAGYPRASAMLNEAVAAGWFVSLFPLHLQQVDWAAAYAELVLEIEICDGRGDTGLATFMAERMGYYDVVLVSRPDNMKLFLAAVESQPQVTHGVRIIYDAEALFTMRAIQQAELAGCPLSETEATSLMDAEIALATNVDAVIAVSHGEAEIFRVRQSAPVYVVSHPAYLRSPLPEFSERRGFLYVGRLLEKDSANYEGLSWFIRAVWPTIRAKLGDVELIVAGSLHPEPSELMAPAVRLLGPVADLGPVYDQARVFIAPNRFGAGVPIKIVEASAAGLPVVASRVMAVQLQWTPGIDLEAEDVPEVMASAAVRLHEDELHWGRVLASARVRLEAAYGHRQFRDSLRAALGSAPRKIGITRNPCAPSQDSSPPGPERVARLNPESDDLLGRGD